MSNSTSLLPTTTTSCTWYKVTDVMVIDDVEARNANARAGVAEEKVQAWLEAGLEKYNVTVETQSPETEADATEAPAA